LADCPELPIPSQSPRRAIARSPGETGPKGVSKEFDGKSIALRGEGRGIATT
jgi:hypothetical protein